ncbi:MAG: adenylyltransferase/cytidyltransferase family protein [Parcubacteria group bacterium]|nr:adenylyltransferase/cytidyltransferase family protein [Parcubacteria group bacterium]MBI3075170.1 adenylyltransferase/cytidyltransferase family protein [Parcubacteria group bacterium]
MIEAGIFSSEASFDKRYIPDHEKLAEVVRYLKDLGIRVVLTSGSFDLLHIGHILYLEAARACGDMLIVGVDSDERIRQRKGPTRPIVLEQERMRILASLRAVDIITAEKADGDGWQLFKKIRPNVLVVSRSTGDATFGEELVNELKRYCDEVKVLPPQAETSTTARVRSLMVNGITQVSPKILAAIMPEFASLLDKTVKNVLAEEEKK